MSAAVSGRERTAGCGLIVAALVALYGLLAAAAIAPVPESIGMLAGRNKIGHELALASGYYVQLPFTSLGTGLPPYQFAAQPKSTTAIRVSPRLADLRPTRVFALVDTATGNGLSWAPYRIRTIGNYGPVLAAIILDGLLLALIIYWLGGILGRNIFARRQRARGAAR